MEEMLKTIATPQFWVLVVIVGILINLASAYLKPQLDRAFSAVSLRWATRTEGQRRQRLERIEHLRGNVNEQLFAYLDGLRIGIKIIAIFSASTSMILLFFIITTCTHDSTLLPTFILFPFAISVILTVRLILDAGRTRCEITEARRSEDRHSQADT